MIYVASHVPPKPSGGVRKLYRHVDVLNRHGMEARILHNVPGQRVQWFQNSTPIAYWNNGRGEKIRPDQDILVVPEPLIHFWAEAEPTATKVIFNQNAYLTFNVDRADRPNIPLRELYLAPNVLGALCVSEDSRQYLQWTFPDLFLQRIRYGIDTSVFRPLPKQPQLAYMPRRGAKHAAQVIGLLHVREISKDWKVVPIDTKTESETAAILGSSAIFLSFSEQEGFGLPPAEAMACECIVIGYHGNGGREYLLPEHSFPIQQGEIVECAKTVKRLIELYQSDRTSFDKIGHAAGEFIRNRYSPEQEEADIVNAWRELQSKRSEAQPAPTRPPDTTPPAR